VREAGKTADAAAVGLFSYVLTRRNAVRCRIPAP
jgi:hypothetical protein